MKIACLIHIFLAITSSQALAPSSGDLDPLDNMTEDQFADFYEHEKVTDPVKKKAMQDALKKNEEIVKKENKEYLEGKKTWYDGINEFADLPEDEFEKEKTGDIPPEETENYGRGLLEPSAEDRVDKTCEAIFNKYRASKAPVPSSYSSVALGLVSQVKSQKRCGSCVAFSSMAAIETCFKKVSGVFGDYSEQQLIDCGYRKNGASGCDGAPTYAYLKYAADSGLPLTDEATYPYLNTQPLLECPVDLKPYNQGARITGTCYTYSGDEETMKKLVYEHGAVVTSLRSAGPFQNYKGGIFAGCTSDKVDHAVTVVGYGTEDGMDYWLIKNSWGADWGENGFIRLKRGVGMCGIGKTMVYVTCEKVTGPTDQPRTTTKPCEDKYSNCPEHAKNSCWRVWVANDCAKSCGTCEGMTKAASFDCYDKYGNCPSLAKTNCHKWGKSCKKSCGLCEGMTPHKTNTCYDAYSNCNRLCWYYGDTKCKLSCGKC